MKEVCDTYSNMPTFEELRNERLKKLEILRAREIDPYPIDSFRDTEINKFLEKFEAYEKNANQIVLAGRVRSIRVHGKAAFLDLEDFSGKVQIFATLEKTKEFSLLIDTLDSGDILECKGNAYTSKTGQESLALASWRFLAKSILPLPSEWFGLKEKEERFRRRYLDMVLNAQVKERLWKASLTLKEIRKFLDTAGFLEMKTPVLQPLAGGALAKPFHTHLNALDMDLYLRIAPELYLKRLLVGGFEKIYELGEVFRNEGMDRDHNPEFLMLELYWAYQNWEGLMKFTEEWLFAVAQNIGAPLATPPWSRKEFETLFEEYTCIIYANADEKKLLTYAKEKKLIINRALSKGKIADEIFKKVVQPHLKNPIFITKLPLDISPFAKQLEGDNTRTARFILYIDSLQLVNGFSEINDPLDQEMRFKDQQEAKERGDEEITEYDKDYIDALSYGMPSAAGLGLGVDRFIMLLTKASSLREIIAFPLMRVKE